MEGGASRLWELIGGGWGDPRGAGEAMKVGPQSRGGPGWRREPELGAVGVLAGGGVVEGPSPGLSDKPAGVQFGVITTGKMVKRH